MASKMGRNDMLKVRGIFDGRNILLDEPLELPANTPVEVLVQQSADEAEELFWKRLQDLGVIAKRQIPSPEEIPFSPVPITGAPLSETIIEDRR